MSIVRINPESEAAWLALRQEDVTSTEIAALFGVSPYKRPWRLWMDKVHPETREPWKDNDRAKWGRRLEATVAKGIAEDQGWEVRHFPYYCRDIEARLGASYDYEVLGKDAVLEVKTVAVDQRHTWITESGAFEAPPHIELQLQQQMMLAGKSRGFIGALVGGNEVIVIEREASPSIQAGIRKVAAEFWASVDAKIEPTPDWTLDAKDVIALRQTVDEGLPVFNGEGNEELEEAVEQYRESAAIAKSAEAGKQAMKAKILTIIGKAKKAAGNGWTISAGTIRKPEYTVKAQEYRDLRVTMKKGGAE